MALNSALTVHLEKPPETLFSTYFVEMRIWLDTHKITPVNFRLFRRTRHRSKCPLRQF